MHWIDVKHVRMFVAVAEHGSFTKAAEQLNIAQPWLSVQIRKLEDSVGFLLFKRGRKQVVELSPKARTLLPVAYEFLEAHQKFAKCASMIRNGFNQQLMIGAPEFSVDVTERHDLIDSLMQKHPDLEIDILNGYSSTLLEKLRSQELDAAFLLGPMQLPDMDTLVIGTTELALLMPAHHRLAILPRIPLEALAGETIGNFRRKFNPAVYDLIAEILASKGISVSFCPEASAMGVRHHAVRHNQPVLVTEWFRDSLARLDGLVLRPVDDPSIRFELLLARRKGDNRPHVAALWKCAKAMTQVSGQPSRDYNHFLSKEQRIDIRSQPMA